MCQHVVVSRPIGGAVHENGMRVRDPQHQEWMDISINVAQEDRWHTTAAKACGSLVTGNWQEGPRIEPTQRENDMSLNESSPCHKGPYVDMPWCFPDRMELAKAHLPNRSDTSLLEQLEQESFSSHRTSMRPLILLPRQRCLAQTFVVVQDFLWNYL